MTADQAAAAETAAPGGAHATEDAESRQGGGLFVVDFHREGNSAAFRTHGWSEQEQGHVWSLQGSCGLTLPAVHAVTPLVLELDFGIPTGRPFVRASVVRVFANGHFIGSGRATGWTRLRCRIATEYIVAGEPIDLRIEHPCFLRMDYLGLSGEDRVLGLCFYAASLYPPWFTRAVSRFAPKPVDGKIIHARPPAPETETRERALYRFAAHEPGCALLQEGWLHDPDGDAWADSRLCTLTVPAPAQKGLYLACFKLSPLYIRSFMASQRISLLLDGAVIAQHRLSTSTSLAIPLPPELYEDKDVLRFSIFLPDGLAMHTFDPGQAPNFLSLLLESLEIRPIPLRHAALASVRDDDVALPVPVATSARFLDESVDDLPGAVKQELGVEITDILRQFESMGDNCAFGLAQRKAGCEILGLLRFGNTPLQGLLTALDDEFKAAADKAQIRLALMQGDPGEYNLFADRYGIRWHTNVFQGSADEETIFAQQAVRLGYLRRKFYEAMRAGRKIVTVSRAEPRKHSIPLPFAGEPAVWEEEPERLHLAEVLPLFLRLNEYGTNTVLYLTRCAHNRRPGTVELLAPGMMRGYVDDFVITPEIGDQDHVTWLRVCVNAWLLDQGPNASFRNKAES